ncbi:phage baseplate assembly protein V [Candidatus Accumulibacter sp. ACC005]|uniref:phage baseplate assembly protein V n=1 Tax=Candidatus Accumulibacter sp. ACC005 TaxID=2823331 RepID=UPI0025BE64BB|nr:phage baseplate assembly protein V [Candidatus Accumulibacter sp. ACC005]
MDRAPHFQPAAGWLNGAQLARVVDIADPERRNRVQLRLLAFDAVDGQDAPLWARVVCPFAGADRGAFLMPDVDDEVLVVFLHGDPRYPLVVGGLWSGANAAPAELGDEGNRFKRIRSKNGVTVTLDDQQGQELLLLETRAGRSSPSPTGRARSPSRMPTAIGWSWRRRGSASRPAPRSRSRRRR